MTTNFKIISFTEIECSGAAFDLHNDFEFIAEDFRINEKQILIHFKKSDAPWTKNVRIQHIYFVVDDYSFLKTIEPQQDRLSDDICLAGITFFDSDFRDEDYGLLTRESPNPDDDIIFSFESERVIRIKAKNIVVTTEPV